MIIYFATIPPGAASEPVCWQEPGELDIAIRWAFQSPQGSAESLRHIRCLLRQAHSAVVGLSPKHSHQGPQPPLNLPQFDVSSRAE